MSKDELGEQPLPENSGEEEEEGEDGEDEESEEDEEPKVCQVCGDRATGYHFNAMTCEGCKGFFRRAMKRPVKFRCPFQNTCVITKSNRRQCQACRLQKCLSIGMLKELIMSDEAVEKRRLQIKRKKMQDEPVLLSPQQEALIEELLAAQNKTFDRSCSKFSQFRPIDRTVNPMFQYAEEPGSIYSFSSSCSQDSEEMEEDKSSRTSGKLFTTLPHVTDLNTYMIQNVINYAKVLSSFRSLTIEDQISLLKGATFEIVQIRFNMLFNETTGIWECGPIHYCMDDAVRAGFQRHLLDPLMKFHYTLRRLHLHDVEYVLMQAISLFSPDRPGVTHHKEIDHQQEILAITLKTYIEAKRAEPEKHLLFPKIMACLTEMRTMNEEYTKQVLQIQDIQPEVSPLMLEVVSKDS
ncbi:nuclear receptor subfamily 1 group I member 2 [Chanos chanos]|uniref:Nuclear receptor subfamily 1 group I member 2 n=1 Tax=Chanos chanos TaxID=29144 RepID=A0A6J2WEF5_CHACN|nr:nuclear receptor subfamily 1 group I member 2 [Chanos chanos]